MDKVRLIIISTFSAILRGSIHCFRSHQSLLKAHDLNTASATTFTLAEQVNEVFCEYPIRRLIDGVAGSVIDDVYSIPTHFGTSTRVHCLLQRIFNKLKHLVDRFCAQ
jgi:hypothetical protein